MNDSQVHTKFVSIDSDLQKIKDRLIALEDQINSTLDVTDLSQSESRLKLIIKANSDLINLIQEKLSTISTPTETRYYLTESEITDFKSNQMKLKAMIADLEGLYRNITSYVASNIR